MSFFVLHRIPRAVYFIRLPIYKSTNPTSCTISTDYKSDSNTHSTSYTMDEFDDFSPAIKTALFSVLGIYFLIPGCMLWIGITSIRHAGLDPHSFMQLAIGAGFLWRFFMIDGANPRTDVGARGMEAVWRTVHNVGWWTQRRMRRAAPLLRRR